MTASIRSTRSVSVDRAGKLVSTFFEKKDEGNFANMVFDEKKLGPGMLVWNAGRDGRVYTSDQFDGYRYQVWRSRRDTRARRREGIHFEKTDERRR